mmetsp:Transcript_14378/g.19847  ORF Transcript_14378/g.19847 Transcript_14378/m.19847 type:complete len:217 (-) Transcript_14378:735-1385(-)
MRQPFRNELPVHGPDRFNGLVVDQPGLQPLFDVRACAPRVSQRGQDAVVLKKIPLGGRDDLQHPPLHLVQLVVVPDAAHIQVLALPLQLGTLVQGGQRQQALRYLGARNYPVDQHSAREELRGVLGVGQASCEEEHELVVVFHGVVTNLDAGSPRLLESFLTQKGVNQRVNFLLNSLHQNRAPFLNRSIKCLAGYGHVFLTESVSSLQQHHAPCQR